MSKNIAISDEVYRQLKQEKGDRSFSDVIADHLDTGRSLEDVAGQGIFAEDAYAGIKAEIRSLSEGTLERLEE